MSVPATRNQEREVLKDQHKTGEISYQQLIQGLLLLF